MKGKKQIIANYEENKDKAWRVATEIMQQTDLKEIVKNDSGSPYNNKAMMSDNSVSSDSIALFIF